MPRITIGSYDPDNELSVEQRKETQRLEAEGVRMAEEQRAQMLADQRAARLAEEAKRKKRQEERERFLTPDIEREAHVRQAQRRVYFMKTKRDMLVSRDDIEFGHGPLADNFLSKMKYADKKYHEWSQTQAIAMVKRDTAGAAAAKKQTVKYMKDYLYYGYVIGVLYGEFVEAARNKSG